MILARLSRAAALASVTLTLLAGGCANGPLSANALPRNDDVFNRIQAGMPRAEIQRMIGLPDETMRFPLSNTVAWDYRYYDTWGYLAVFSVTFADDGHAVSKITRRLNDGGDHGTH
jgi:hypothetical protein